MRAELENARALAIRKESDCYKHTSCCFPIVFVVVCSFSLVSFACFCVVMQCYLGESNADLALVLYVLMVWELPQPGAL